MQSQWVYVPGGMGPPIVSGLNYLVLFAFMDRMELSKAEFEDLFEDIQTLEYAGLETMRD